MKHYGDVTKINGGAVETVDIITGGSPCQDLSVAGKRAGLDGERSGLFMEQVRIVKEMREHDVRTNGRTVQFIRPRYMVFENVPGLFSSNGGKDFQAVLTEIARIAEPECPDVPMPEKNKWRKSGCIYDGMGQWSIAWRVHDAQFWGVPQRRKRIALVADFGGLTAPEILFERKGLSRDIEPGAEKREETAGSAGSGADSASGAMNPWDSQSAIVYQNNGVWHSLNANENGGQSRDALLCLQGNGINRAGKAISFQERAGCEGVGKGILIQDERTGALSTLNNQSVVYDGCTITSLQNASNPQPGDPCHTLHDDSRNLAVIYGICSYESNSMKSSNPNSGIYEADTARTLDNNGGSPACNQGGMVVLDARGNGDGSVVSTITGDHENRVMDYTELCVGNGPVVRRLTPKECERLQGFDQYCGFDGWTDIGEWTDSKGKRHKDADSPRYKALGNSIALPFWAWLARRICAQYERPMTMASLFDGIGGFPLVFSRAGCVPVWASEIEEFPIAVTKKRFPDE